MYWEGLAYWGAFWKILPPLGGSGRERESTQSFCQRFVIFQYVRVLRWIRFSIMCLENRMICFLCWAVKISSKQGCCMTGHSLMTMYIPISSMLDTIQERGDMGVQLQCFVVAYMCKILNLLNCWQMRRRRMLTGPVTTASTPSPSRPPVTVRSRTARPLVAVRRRRNEAAMTRRGICFRLCRSWQRKGMLGDALRINWFSVCVHVRACVCACVCAINIPCALCNT